MEIDSSSKFSFETFIHAFQDKKIQHWLEPLIPELSKRILKHGSAKEWIKIVSQIPLSKITPEVDKGAISWPVSYNDFLSKDTLVSLLQQLLPWRKGPWKIGDIIIDTEWHSDWKWERVAPHIQNLEGKTVLDVGCGNGYHAYRMALAGAKRVMGIDPGVISVIQAQVMYRLNPSIPAWVIPLGIEDLPQNMPFFDTVFSMGVLYHRKSPIEHLQHLKGLLKPGGELVLETLIIEDSFGDLLVPRERYAKMRNVWFIPTVTMLIQWLERCGFKEVRCVDVTQTSVEEQRSTSWMTNESLPHFLDSQNQDLTIEGYPAPRRAVLLATK